MPCLVRIGWFLREGRIFQPLWDIEQCFKDPDDVKTEFEMYRWLGSGPMQLIAGMSDPQQPIGVLHAKRMIASQVFWQVLDPSLLLSPMAMITNPHELTSVSSDYTIACRHFKSQIGNFVSDALSLVFYTINQQDDSMDPICLIAHMGAGIPRTLWPGGFRIGNRRWANIQQMVSAGVQFCLRPAIPITIARPHGRVPLFITPPDQDRTGLWTTLYKKTVVEQEMEFSPSGRQVKVCDRFKFALFQQFGMQGPGYSCTKGCCKVQSIAPIFTCDASSIFVLVTAMFSLDKMEWYVARAFAEGRDRSQQKRARFVFREDAKRRWRKCGFSDIVGLDNKVMPFGHQPKMFFTEMDGLFLESAKLIELAMSCGREHVQGAFYSRTSDPVEQVQRDRELDCLIWRARMHDPCSAKYISQGWFLLDYAFHRFPGDFYFMAGVSRLLLNELTRRRLGRKSLLCFRCMCHKTGACTTVFGKKYFFELFIWRCVKDFIFR